MKWGWHLCGEAYKIRQALRISITYVKCTCGAAQASYLKYSIRTYFHSLLSFKLVINQVTSHQLMLKLLYCTTYVYNGY